MGRRKKEEKKDNKEELGEAKKLPKFDIAGDAKRSIAAVFLFALALIIMLGFFGKAGVIGESLGKAAGLAIGWAKLVFPLFLIIAGIVLLLRKETAFYVSKLIGLSVTLLGIAGLLHWIYGAIYGADKMAAAANAGLGGGYAGYAAANLAVKYAGMAGGLVVIFAIFLTGFIVAFNFSIIHFFQKIFAKKEKAEFAEDAAVGAKNSEAEKTEEAELVKEEIKKEESPVGLEKNKEDENIGKIEFVEGPDHFNEGGLSSEISRKNFAVKNGRSQRKTTANSGIDFSGESSEDWILPSIELLEKGRGGAEGGDTEKNAEIIEKTFKSFGIEVERGGIQIGPSVTQYSFKPAVGIKVSKILELNSNLAMALAKHPIRIEAPIPGKSLIGIEVPNIEPAIVRLRDSLESEKFGEKESSLTLALGEDVSGEYIVADLGKMPHLLIAGATGTGKSVCVNAIITALLYQNSPEDLKFIMVDPKRVELSLYSGIPHLLSPVITENGKVINALKWVVGEMEKRYRLLQDMKSQNIDSYNEKRNKGQKRKYTDPETGETIEEPMEKLPYIVVVIDELAELMMSHGKEVEGAIVRIAQLARAVGIHLVVSTQRPEVKVITGLIKANINARVAFKVNTQVDSRTILDMGGAEKLLGKGDMLFLSSDSPKTKRIQGIFVSETEVKKVVKFINNQYEEIKKRQGEKIDEGDEIGVGEPITNPVFQGAAAVDFSLPPENEDKDDLYEAAKAEVLRAGKASASLLQRRLRVGYARAARLLDILENNGLIGPSDGAKPREVFGAKNSPEEAIGYESPVDDQVARDKWQI